MFQEIIYDLLLGLRVQTSDIEGDQLEILPFSFDSGKISVDSRSLSVVECVSSTVSVRQFDSHAYRRFFLWTPTSLVSVASRLSHRFDSQ